MKTLILVALSGLFLAPSLRADSFQWVDKKGIHLDLKYGERPVIRYQYEAIDESTPERRHDTYKPFHHVFDWAGKDFITKGPGGKYPHHRGIYYGFSRCSYTDNEGKTFSKIDTWHCKKAHQIHRKLVKQEADEKGASMTSTIGWIGNEGVEFASENRTLSFRFENDQLVVDFHSVLTPLFPKVAVDGDPQHAGFQFRATNEVSTTTSKKTYYIRPGTGKAEMGKTINWSAKNDDESTRDLPWKAMSFLTGEDRYTVLYLDSPTNPKPARFSERDYGRFGSYFVKELTPESPLEVNYRLVIQKGEMTVEEIEALHQAWSKKG